MITINKSGNEQLRIQSGTYKGIEYIDIRVYYYNAAQQEWKPSRKGVAFKRELLPEVVKALEQVAREHKQQAS